MIQILFNGLLQGLLLATLSVGFALVYSTTRVFYIALGGIYVLAPYVLLTAIQLGVPLIVGILSSMLICVLLSIVCEEAIHWPFERKRAPAAVQFIGSLGAFLVIVQVVAVLWGTDTQLLEVGMDNIYQVGDVRLTEGQVTGGVLSLVILVLLLLWIHNSQLGLQFRALSDNSTLLSIFGSDIRKLRRVVFGISGGIAGAISILTAIDLGFNSDTGMITVLVGIAATILGGVTSLLWVSIAGLSLGIIRAQIVWHLSAQWEDALTFILLALGLFFLPGGLYSLFSGKKRLEAGV